MEIVRDSAHIVVVGVVEEVGVAEVEEVVGVAIIEIETEVTMTMTMMIVMMKKDRETILGIVTTPATGKVERSDIGAGNVVIVMTKDGREGEGAGEEGGDSAAIVMMTERREGVGIGGDVTIGVMVTKMVERDERDKRDAVKAETGMIGT